MSGKKKKTCDACLPGNLTHVLEIAAPVYRAHDWPAHDLANRRWVMRVAPLVREQGVGLSQRLADIYQAKWPKDKIRVDMCAYANRSGAYTTLDPLRVTISSTDPPSSIKRRSAGTSSSGVGPNGTARRPRSPVNPTPFPAASS